MKHLKTFEYVVYFRDISVGDYVLIDDQNYYSSQLPQWSFVHNTVGKIVNLDKDSIGVTIEYKNIPLDIKRYFKDEKILTFTIAKIKYHGKTKEDVEAMIASEKYNL